MSSEYKKSATVSERLKIAMKETGKKQADLVRATGIDKGSISHYVSGRYEPKSDAISRLAFVLDVSESWLWGFDAPKDRAAEQKHDIEPEEDIENYADTFDLADIIARLRSDAEFREIVEKLCAAEFYELVKKLCKLDSAKLNSVINMLNAFT